MTFRSFIAEFCLSKDGKLAEPAKNWLDHSFIATFLCLIAPVLFAIVVTAMEVTIPFYVSLFLPQILLGGFLTWFLLRDDRHIEPRVKLQLFKLQPFPVLMLIKTFIMLIFCTIILSSAIMKLANFFGYQLPQQPLTLFLMKADWMQSTAIIISAVVIAPILEEWSFRRVIFGKLATVFSCPIAMVLTSLLFSLMHGNILHAPSLFVMGLILQGIMRRSSSIICPIILHAAFNLFNVLMILLAVHFNGPNLN